MTVSNLSNQQVVRQSFLWCVAAIYLFAFTSLYVQIPGEFTAFISYRSVLIYACTFIAY